MMLKIDRIRTASAVIALCGDSAFASISQQPDVLATWGHFGVLNPVLGTASGILLAKFFYRGKVLGEALRNIAANYVAAALALALALLGLRPLLTWPGFECATLAAWPLTILAAACCPILYAGSYGVFAMLFRRKQSPRRVLLTGVVTGAVVGTVVVGWYAYVLPRSLFTKLELVRQIHVPPPAGFSRLWVYYISPDGRHVASVALDGTASGRVIDLPATTNATPIVLSIDDNARGSFLRVTYADGEEVRVDFDRVGEVAAFDSSKTVGWTEYGIASLEGESKWTAKPLFRSNAILAVSSESSEEHYGFDTPVTFPVGAWFWSGNRYTILPGGFVVFCIGRRDIFIVDLENRRVSFLAQGYSPLVFAEQLPGQ